MIQARVVLRCPVCSQIQAAAALLIFDDKVEITCAECGVATRFPTYQASAHEGSAPLASSTAHIDNGELGERQPLPTDLASATPDTTAATLQLHDDASDFSSTTRKNDKLDKDMQTEQVLKALADLPQVLVQAYTHAVAAGDTIASHADVVKLAVASGCLTDVGKLYRSRSTVLGDDDVCKAMREHVVNAAFISLRPLKAQKAAPASGVKTLVAFIFMLGGMAILTYVLFGTQCALTGP